MTFLIFAFVNERLIFLIVVNGLAQGSEPFCPCLDPFVQSDHTFKSDQLEGSVLWCRVCPSPPGVAPRARSSGICWVMSRDITS